MIKTVGGNTTNYLWDREMVLAMMVGDGTNWYLHADNLIAEVDNANEVKYRLNDALGSTRGLTDGAGALVGSADYDVFGSMRLSSGAPSVFGFTGEQFDSETGFTFLRARYLNPTLGRFISTDSVQPNAPGTQGYNLYAYVANNPTIWTDPSGHSVDFGAAASGLAGIPYMRPMLAALNACSITIPGCSGWIATAFSYIATRRIQPTGMAVGTLGIIAVLCYLTPLCRDLALRIQDVIETAGSDGQGNFRDKCIDLFVDHCGPPLDCGTCLHNCITNRGVWPEWLCPLTGGGIDSILRLSSMRLIELGPLDWLRVGPGGANCSIMVAS